MRILIVDLLNIGDLLFTTPSLRALRNAYPAAEIDMLVPAQFSDVLRHNPNIDNLIGFDKGGQDERLPGFLRMVSLLRRNRYDLVINYQVSARASLISWLCGAKRRVGTASSVYRRMFHQVVESDEQVHRADMYLQILRDLSIPAGDDGKMEMFIDDASEAAVEALWREEGLDSAESVVGLNPGARVELRRWPVEKWADLADRLERDGCRTVLLGGPGEKDIADSTISRMKSQPVVLTGKLSLLELGAVAKKCTVFVTSDTGPLHIAVSVGAPVVTLFGPTRPEHTGPYKARSVVVESDVPCAACRGEKGAAHICLRSIETDDAYAGVKRLLAEIAVSR